MLKFKNVNDTCISLKPNDTLVNLNSNGTLINLPEVTVKLKLPIMNDCETSLNWLVDGNAVTRYIPIGGNLNKEVDVRTKYDALALGTPIQAPDMIGEPIPDRLLVFPAIGIRVPKDEVGVLGMRVVFSCRGNQPVDELSFAAGMPHIPSNTNLPIVTCDICFQKLFQGECGSMKVGSLNMEAGDQATYGKKFDIYWEGLPTVSPENPDLKNVTLEVGITHTPLTLGANKDIAMQLYAQQHRSVASISSSLLEHANKRHAEIHHLISSFAGDEVSNNCNLSMIMLKMGSEAGGCQAMDHVQWHEGIDYHTSKIAASHMESLFNASVVVGHELCERLGLPVNPTNLLQAVKSVSPDELGDLFLRAIEQDTAAGMSYAYDAQETAILEINKNLIATPQTKTTGENMSPAGQMNKATMAVNRQNYVPIIAGLKSNLSILLRDNIDSHLVHKSYTDQSPAVRKGMEQLNETQRNGICMQGDCEDSANQIISRVNACIELHVNHVKMNASGQTSKLDIALAQVAKAFPDLSEHVDTAKYVILAIGQRDKRVFSSLVLAAGAKQDENGNQPSAPVPLNAPDVGKLVEMAMRTQTMCGHCCAATTEEGPLSAASPIHMALSLSQKNNMNLNTKVSELTRIGFLEGTGIATECKESMDNVVKVNFEPVDDLVLSKKLDTISATPMPAYQATNLISAIQIQAMQKTGNNVGMVQKYNFNDPACFYRNIIAYGDGLVYSSGQDYGSYPDGKLHFAPTGYIPNKTQTPITSVMIKTKITDAEKSDLKILFDSREAMNIDLKDVLADMSLYEFSRPPLHLRGEIVVDAQSGSKSSLVIKNAMYPRVQGWNWEKENDARRVESLARGMASYRNISSATWIASFYTNPMSMASAPRESEG
ncbi:MAG: hypothetical protein OSB26_17265 [Woeseiaceae bacterium]|nr:hypothetical protein [Woeseiaceae bacterium]